MWEIMSAEINCEIHLTESLAMDPPASVCGLYFAHPKSTYFATGKITKDQVAILVSWMIKSSMFS